MRSTRGNLVQPLIDAAGDRARAESDIVEVLHRSFPAWRQRFPAGLCWRWVPPRGIEIYEVLGAHDPSAKAQTQAAVEHLLERGFVTVIVHDHAATRKLACACPTFEERQTP